MRFTAFNPFKIDRQQVTVASRNFGFVLRSSKLLNELFQRILREPNYRLP